MHTNEYSTNMVSFVCMYVKKLLQVHTSHMQREEASPASIKRYKHCRDNVWRSPQPSLWETDGGSQPSPQADPVPVSLLSMCHFWREMKGGNTKVISRSPSNHENLLALCKNYVKRRVFLCFVIYTFIYERKLRNSFFLCDSRRTWFIHSRASTPMQFTAVLVLKQPSDCHIHQLTDENVITFLHATFRKTFAKFYEMEGNKSQISRSIQFCRYNNLADASVTITITRWSELYCSPHQPCEQNKKTQKLYDLF